MKRRSFHLSINILFPVTAIIISVLSLLPRLSVLPPSIPFLDKFAHGAAYCLLGFLAYFFIYLKKSTTLGGIVFSLLFCTALGTSLEFLQAITERTPDFFDGLANFTGCLLGSLVAIPVQKRLFNT
jgi:VanZ family protein